MGSSITQNKNNQGFSLIEALVTMVILAVSLLGLAVLQGQGLSLTTDSYARSQASILSFDIIERIRANAVNLSDYGGTAASTCDQLVASSDNDLACWQQSITEALGSGSSGTITVDTTVPSVVISVNWMERQLRQDSAQSYADDVTKTASWVTEL
jgi:type IV pilus assembly protein PilV